MAIAIRNATRADAADMAVLIDMAGHGLPAWLWQKRVENGEAGSALEAGRARAMRDDGAFSWRNAAVAEESGAVIGMLLGYRQPNVAEEIDTATLSPVLVPLVELEAGAPASWYVNAVAVYCEHRGRGVGSLLMGEAEARARASAATSLSLIVEDVNAGAIALYSRLGFAEAARRDYVSFPLGPLARAWLLMVKPLAAALH